MLRNILFLFVLLLIAATAGWMAEHPGQLSIEWFGYAIETSAAFLVVSVVAAAAIVWLTLRLLTTLLFMPRQLAHRRTGLQQERGLQAITDAFVALGEQDPTTAAKYIKEATRYMPEQPLPKLLSLQIARQLGDEENLRAQFLALEHSPQTRPLALRGLIEEARRDGRMDDALRKAEELLKLKPRHKPTLLLVLDLYSWHRRWQEALQLISNVQKRMQIPREEARHLAALIYHEQAQAMLKESNTGSALEMLRAAVKKAPDFVPAVLLYAERSIEDKKHKQAAAAIRRAWQAQPHPDLSLLYEKALADLNAEKRLVKVKEMVKSTAAHWESLVAVGRAALEAKDYVLARKMLKQAIGQRETATLCRLMSELELQERKDEAQSRAWLDRSGSALPDANWQCESCGHQPEDWQAHCPECRHFDSIRWQAPRYAVYSVPKAG